MLPPAHAAALHHLDSHDTETGETIRRCRRSSMVSCCKTPRHYVRAGSSLALLLCIAIPAAGTVKRNDTVVMKNGDRLTGDVKKMENGLLYIDTVYVSGSVGVDWNQVERIESTATYQVTLINGKRVTGKIEKAVSDEGRKDFVVRKPGGDQRYSSAEIASIDSEKPGFWHQLKGSIDSGYSFTSGNAQTSTTTDANATYTTKNWSAAARLDTSFSGQSGASKTNKIEGQFSGERFLSRNSFLVGIADFLHSSQQDLDLRTTIGGGYGRYWIRTANTNLGWLSGVVYANEHFSTASTQPRDHNVEALLGLQYDSHKFNLGDFHSQTLLFPGLSDTGRVRVTTNNSLTINLVNNFHVTFSFWDNFDSRPPATAKRNELGVSSGIGWSF
jgi:putative salt-induced outer membrane protein YdiY